MFTVPKLLAAAGIAMLSCVALPGAHAQPLPGGSVELPVVEPVPVATPVGSTAQQLPALPFPFFWAGRTAPAPSTPTYVASNWVEPFSYCVAPNQRAFAQNGTQLWCSRVERTDAHVWAPYSSTVPHSHLGSIKNRTEVANSLGAKPCGVVGTTALDPSNGQEAFCDWRRLVSDVPIWQYNPGS